MNLLAIESSTESCSVALRVGDEILSRSVVEPRAHARLILPWAGELLAEAGMGFGQLDALAVSRGPGSFTSLRIGLGIVQGIALAHDLPVRPVSSLDALALDLAAAHPGRPFLALLDARMGEVYAGWYGATVPLERMDEERLLPPAGLARLHGSALLAAGPGARAHAEVLTSQGFDLDPEDKAWPDARAILSLAEQANPVPAWELEPLYLRDQVTG